MTGMIIATVIGRLIWPVLPQRVLRDDLLAIVAQLKALLCGDPHQERIRTQLAILPVEALQAAGQIRLAGCSEQERGKIAALIRNLQGLVMQATELVSRRHILPEITEAILRPQFERLEIEFKQDAGGFRRMLSAWRLPAGVAERPGRASRNGSGSRKDSSEWDLNRPEARSACADI